MFYCKVFNEICIIGYTENAIPSKHRQSYKQYMK